MSEHYTKLCKVFICGPYSGPNILTCLANIRRGISLSTDLLKTGEYAVFCPFLDYQFGIVDAVTMEQYKNNSLAFVSSCDAMLGCPGWEVSQGTLAEIAEGKEWNIPFFDSVEELSKWKREKFDPIAYSDGCSCRCNG